MGYLVDKLFKKSASADLLHEIFGGRINWSGKSITVNTAMQVATVFAVCRVVGEGVAQVPLKLMRESDDGKTNLPAKKHRLYDIMGLRPNDFMTSFEYRELIVMHTILTGNHYSFINRVGGKIVELLPIAPDRVVPKRDADWTITYEVHGDNGEIKTYPAEAIWHMKGPSWNGWHGLECVKLAREAIGLSLALEESTARLHKNGVRPSGIYSVEGTLKDDQYKALKTWLEKNIAGSENTGAPLILDRGAKWISTAMTGVDAQSLENRKFQIAEICRFARVNPIMVYGDDKLSTYAGSTANFLSHLVHTLAPWYQRLEQSMDVHLLTEAERANGYFFNFVEEGLLRTSMLETKDVLLGYVNGGLMTPNEGRRKLDLNPVDDPEADKLRIPANIVGNTPTEPPAPQTDSAVQDIVA